MLLEPALDGVAFIGVAVGAHDRVDHDLRRDGTKERVRCVIGIVG